MKSKDLLLVSLIIVFLIILTQNAQVVTFRFLFWKLSMSQIILVVLSGLIGVLIGYNIARK